jgi:signal transduction histidine kinase
MNCCRAVKELSRDIYPTELGSGGLVQSLGDLASHAEDRHGVRCPFTFSIDHAPPGHEIALHLFYIAQEAIKNAINHGKAKKIAIRLQSRQGRTSLGIEDDGVGFHPGEQAEGIGLRIIRYRARVMGASLDLTSKPGEGTRLTCLLDATPLKE